MEEPLRESIYRLAATGVATDQIAAVTGKTPGAIRRELKRKDSKQRVEQLKGSIIQSEVDHQFGLRGLLPQARQVLQDALYQGDSRTRPKVAQWLHEAVISKPAVKNELKIQGVIQHDLAPLFEQMGDHLRALREANSQRDPLARVKVGTASLVRQMLPEKAGE